MASERLGRRQLHRIVLTPHLPRTVSVRPIALHRIEGREEMGEERKKEGRKGGGERKKEGGRETDATSTTEGGQARRGAQPRTAYGQNALRFQQVVME